MHNPSQLTHVKQGSARSDHPVVRWTLIALAMSVVGLLVIVPVINVFAQALSAGWKTYWDSLVVDRDTRHAILLTLIVAPIAVAVNTVFGVAAAWTISRFRFPGRTLLTTLIDLPFSVSPVVAGLSLVLIFGLQGYLGPWLREHNIKVIFALPGLILATTFVTLPFVARELIPVMEAIGSEEEVAAVSLGANPWQTFWYVTLPNIKWGLLYGVVLCNARAMGEFGAVYVVSGHIAGRTDTMPLRVEKLFQEYNTPGSFAVASVLTLLALVTLAAKVALERKTRAELREAAAVANGGGDVLAESATGTTAVGAVGTTPVGTKGISRASQITKSHMIEFSRGAIRTPHHVVTSGAVGVDR
jgi:sulfate/thiosulfate transport system permease protein